LAKNRISCHNQSVYPRHPLYFLGTVEKSDFGKKSDFLSQSIRLFIPVIRCTFWARLRNQILAKNFLSQSIRLSPLSVVLFGHG
jgi:hypothetical protein